MKILIFLNELHGSNLKKEILGYSFGDLSVKKALSPSALDTGSFGDARHS